MNTLKFRTTDQSFSDAIGSLQETMRLSSHEVHPDTWQGMHVAKKPEMLSYELMNVYFSAPLDGTDLDYYKRQIEPNLPWADDHFLERVCGEPINPGVTYQHWPWAKSSERFLSEGQFNHNYMERYWPSFAGQVKRPTYYAEDFTEALHQGEVSIDANRGIRGQPYNDILDLVAMLAHDPFTRQAWIPIFFPEDTGIEGRKPCTLGYQFIMRGEHLHVYYPLRSCDFVRHFRDDIYLTVRLLLWVLEKCKEFNPDRWCNIAPGTFSMHCTSLHIFKNDWVQLFGSPRKNDSLVAAHGI